MDFTAKHLLFALLISSTKALEPCGFQPDNSDLPVIPIYDKYSPFNQPKPESWVNTIIDMSSKDPTRVKYLSTLAPQKTTAVPIASGLQLPSICNYVVKVKLGTPGQTMFMVLDTSNDIAWAPCSDCTGCSPTTFSPNASSSYGSLGCSLPQCTQVHGLSCPAIGAAACSYNQSYVPPQGLLGLGRGPLSLILQSGSLYSIVFSYCLPSFKSYYFSGSLKLGHVGQPDNIQTTPLLKNPHRPSLYYVNLTGVSVGQVQVPIAPEYLAFNPNPRAGTFIDSGTVVTRFVQPIYQAIRNEFVKQVKGPFTTIGVFETCFDASAEVEAPLITLHFEGLSLKLPMENSFLHTSAGSRACLTIAPVPNNVKAAMNVIANLQQQNHRILFDVANSRLGIAHEACN
ncbi:eukaryotic translation initiation factor 3 subunit C-like [Hibiscus syriacus]|uniref:Eukaryotic translation initiation factor 3 subunit C-like n=1 Tax=Hibiscus syriacus TaxID=106335 RepID=A0A6A2XJM3_HIBSY|nr:eukaryotic translation initiation factor 3 subunit C-like [Hibiscus syriacus]